LTNGKCQPCNDYSYAFQDNTRCITDDCGDQQIVLIDGTCEDCGSYSKADDETGYECRPDTCL
jgi:hypothetical protein